MDFLAMICAVSGAFLTALKTNTQRFFGFILYMLANVLWVMWAFSQNDVVWAIVGQNSIFIIPAFLGAWNNKKERNEVSRC